MIKDAELNKEADKKFKEDQDTLNSADSLVISLEKQLAEHGEKIPEDLKSQLNEKIAQVKSQKDAKDITSLKSSMNDLQQLAMKIGESIYSTLNDAANSNGSKSDGSENSSSNADGSVDAEVVS